MKYIVFLKVFNNPVMEKRLMDIIKETINENDQIIEVYKLVNEMPKPDAKRSKTKLKNNKAVLSKALTQTMLNKAELLYFTEDNLYKTKGKFCEPILIRSKCEINVLHSNEGFFKKELVKANSLFTSTHENVTYQLI